MKRLIAALLSFMLILTAHSGTVQANGNDTSTVNEQQYTRIGEDYEILDENVLLAKKDGTVWSWHTTGTMGDSFNPSDTFYTANLVQIPELQDVKQIVIRRNESIHYKYMLNYVALKNDGTVWHWDAQPSAIHRKSPSYTPSSIEGLDNVTSLAANFHNRYKYKTVFVLKSDGSVWYWGSRIGDSKKGPSTPVYEKLLDGVISIKSVDTNVYAIKADGSVWSWSAASYLPHNISKNKDPEKIEGLVEIINIEPGYYTNYAFKRDGTVWSWPKNHPRSIPVQLHKATDARSIVEFSGNQDMNIDRTYAFRADGQLWSVESDDNVFPGLKDIVSVHQRRSYPSYYYVLKRDQTLWAWAGSSSLPKLVVFTKKTATGDSPGTTDQRAGDSPETMDQRAGDSPETMDKTTDNRPKTTVKATGDRPKTTTQPAAKRTSPEISLSPFITMLQPGEKQSVAVNNLLPGTKVTYTIDDPSIGTLSNVNGTQVVKANKSGQTIVRATATRAGYPDVNAYFLLYVVDSKMLSDTYFNAVRSVPVVDRQSPFIVEGLTQAGELIITAASSEKLVPVNGQFAITPELVDRLAGNALEAKSAVEKTLTENKIPLARKLSVNGKVLPLPEQKDYTFKLYKESLSKRKDLDYITVHVGDAKLVLNLATADRLFDSLPVIVIRLIKENNGYRVDFLDGKGQKLSNVTSNIGLILPSDQTDATHNSVFYTNGEITQPIGGKFNPNKNGMEVEINRSGTYFLDDNLKSFPDVDNRDPELKQAVQFLASKGIVTGKNNGNFEPDSLLTRAEFTAMLVRAFYALDETAKESFSDVHPPKWHVPYIASSEKKHIVEGYPDGTFKPDRTISREEMTAIGARSLHEKKKYFYPPNREEYLSQFIDQETISKWARPTMSLAVKQRLIDVPADKQIRAREAVTRGEAARMLYRLYLQL